MAQLPSALACHASRPSRRDLPMDWTAKSMMVVVPPNAAARVPVSNVSLANVPPNGSSMWVWTSMPPGMTYLPAASMVRSIAPAEPESPAPMAEMVSPSTSTSARWEPSALTTVPLTMSVRIRVPPWVLGFGSWRGKPASMDCHPTRGQDAWTGRPEGRSASVYRFPVKPSTEGARVATVSVRTPGTALLCLCLVLGMAPSVAAAPARRVGQRRSADAPRAAIRDHRSVSMPRRVVSGSWGRSRADAPDASRRAPATRSIRRGSRSSSERVLSPGTAARAFLARTASLFGVPTPGARPEHREDRAAGLARQRGAIRPDTCRHPGAWRRAAGTSRPSRGSRRGQRRGAPGGRRCR